MLSVKRNPNLKLALPRPHPPALTRSLAHSLAREYPEASAGAPVLFGANLPEGMTGPELVRAQLGQAAAAGLNTVRAWVQPVSPQYALQPAPGKFNEAAFQGLDYMLEEARKNNMRVILSLTTNWSPTGGVPQYLGWAGSSDPADFYNSDQIKQWYKELASEVTGRVNTINGRVYADDPTILAYDLINEPRCEGCPAGTVSAWVNEMAPLREITGAQHPAHRRGGRILR